jgi:hypothetical protein
MRLQVSGGSKIRIRVCGKSKNQHSQEKEKYFLERRDRCGAGNHDQDFDEQVLE